MQTACRVSPGEPGGSVRSGIFVALLAFSLPLAAQDVGLAGIMGSKAMLMVNGGEPEAVRVGETLGGVKLLSIQGDQVVVEVGGRKRPLRVGQHAVGSAAADDGSGKVVLVADRQGHYYANGTVNGKSVRFIVDTGASLISLGASDARRLGLDFDSGEKGISQTANGQVQVSRIKLDTVTIGGITLHRVDAAIHKADMPALLGMSFLSRMEILQDGGTMTLRQRF